MLIQREREIIHCNVTLVSEDTPGIISFGTNLGHSSCYSYSSSVPGNADMVMRGYYCHAFKCYFTRD